MTRQYEEDAMTHQTIEDLSWSDALVLGYEPMDAVHREFVELLGEVQQAADDGLLVALRKLLDHLQSHFDAEDELMRAHDFPPRDCHIDEHAAVLRSAHEVMQILEEGAGHDVVRGFAAELARWFPGHTDYLDSALAHWMVKRLHGGKPVVLRRQIAPGRIPAESVNA